jgi:hypothetical protein
MSTTSLKEMVVHTLDNLDERELAQVAEYLAFLKYRERSRSIPHPTIEQMKRYEEFADEDRRLADEGMADYAQGLHAEDNS